ncbi:15-hydroxyprostaglandin dehydrogenase [NAD(+)] [Betta splendens]|uniref:15-hydroxyprostaglandin dehydrogenase [NAD(+)] n=1 Tax=Betta splendens TaxID=158456 RepID=A0A6P7PK51_BETSP|nr:15-hydroxyprostaglandin dehydrogenase [NAD(+)] [Betta splendens]
MALSGKVAVVTGGAMGIGRAITETLLQSGATVVLLDVNESAAKSLLDDLHKVYGRDRTLFLSCTVESEEQVKAALQKTVDTFGGIDILCNNAGILNEGEWEKTVSINLLGVIRGTYVALQHMNKLTGGRGGVVINTASMAGLGPLLSCPVYTASKHGVVGFTRAMAAASKASDYGIRFNAVCPGFVQTDLISNTKLKLGQFSHLEDATNQLMAEMRMLAPSEVAACVLELATDETKNGEALMVFAQGKQYVTFPTL